MRLSGWMDGWMREKGCDRLPAKEEGRGENIRSRGLC
jgi:hypothetical protein